MLFVILCLSCGCVAHIDIPKPATQQAAGIGIEVKLRGPLGYPLYNADVVYFAKTDIADNATEEFIAQTNYANSGRVYFLNAPPGDYSAVAASFKTPLSSDNYITYFPQDLVRISKVSIKESHIYYAGSHILDMSIGICTDEADDAQLHYAALFDPNSKKCGFVVNIMDKIAKTPMLYTNNTLVPLDVGLTYHYRGSIYESANDTNSKIEFINNALNDLRNSEWHNVIREQSAP